MIFPLILVALALGAVATYGLSPKVHTWVDEHVQALRDASVAHKVADTHLDASATATDHSTAVSNVNAADTANKVGAQKTADAGKTAKTPQQRADVAESAKAIADREGKIATQKARLGVGKCGVQPYKNVSPLIKDAILMRLHDAGMTVTGNNPWHIDTNQNGVKLSAEWDPQTLELRVIVEDWGVLARVAGCEVVWGKINPVLKRIIGQPS